MIRVIDDHNEKYITRPLYEEIFDHDGKGFVDYYYEDRCQDNRILVDEEADETGAMQVVSMVHLNPYKVSVKGEIVDAYYVFAVATKPSYRHQGRMAALLQKAFALSAEEGKAFLFLIPVDVKIYEPFDFHVVAELQQDKSVPYEEIQKEYDVYCIRDEDYLRRMRREEELAAMGETQELPEHSVIMMRWTEKYDNLKYYFCEEV